jgi:chromate transporter
MIGGHNRERNEVDAMEKKNVNLLKLFLSMMTISAFTFGGGFVIIGMMRKEFCDELLWVSDDEVLDMTAIDQSAPGALAGNSAVIFGYRIAGIAGALTSVLATIIPPIVIISVVCMIYDAFSTNVIVQTALQVMRAGVAAIIVDVVIDLAGNVVKTKNILNICLMIAAFVATWYFKVSSIVIILLFIALGLGMSMLNRKEAA